MSNQPPSDNDLRRKEFNALALIISILILLFLIAIADSNVSARFLADAANEHIWCASRHQYERDCRSFWYKTLSDPTVAWSFWYSVLTFILIIGAAVTIHNNRRQIRDVNRHFAIDQRPWLKVEITVNPEIEISPTRMILRATIRLQNIGKSPAFRVTRGWLFLRHPEDNSIAFWNEIRNDIDARMVYMGTTILPGELRIEEHTIDVLPRAVEMSRSVGGLSSGVVVVSYKYKSNLSNNTHESSRLYSVFIGGGMPLHMVGDLYKRSLEGVKIFGSGVFEIAS